MIQLDYTPVDFTDFANIIGWYVPPNREHSGDWQCLRAFDLNPDLFAPHTDTVELWVNSAENHLQVSLVFNIDGKHYSLENGRLNTDEAHEIMTAMNITVDDLPKELREPNPFQVPVFPFVDGLDIAHSSEDVSPFTVMLEQTRRDVTLRNENVTRLFSSLTQDEIAFLDTLEPARYIVDEHERWNIDPEYVEDGELEILCQVGAADRLAEYRYNRDHGLTEPFKDSIKSELVAGNQQDQSQEKVTLYSMPNCQACRMTQKALEKAGVPFEIVDLEQQPELVDEFREQGLLQAPVVEFDGERSAGFRPDRIRNIAASLTRPSAHAIAQATHQPPSSAPIQTPPTNAASRTR